MQEAEEFHTWQVNQYWYPGGTAGVFAQGILNPAEVWALPFFLSFFQLPASWTPIPWTELGALRKNDLNAFTFGPNVSNSGTCRPYALLT